MHPIVYYVKENNEKYHGTFPLRKYHWVFYCRLQMQSLEYRGVHKSTDKEYGPGPWYSYPDSEGTIASMYNVKKWEKLAQSCFEFNFQTDYEQALLITESKDRRKFWELKNPDIWWSNIPQTLSKIKNHYRKT